MSTPNLGLEVLFSGHKLTVTQNATYIKGPNSQVRFVNAKTPLKVSISSTPATKSSRIHAPAPAAAAASRTRPISSIWDL